MKFCIGDGIEYCGDIIAPYEFEGRPWPGRVAAIIAPLYAEAGTTPCGSIRFCPDTVPFIDVGLTGFHTPPNSDHPLGSCKFVEENVSTFETELSGARDIAPSNFPTRVLLNCPFVKFAPAPSSFHISPVPSFS